MKTIAQKIAKLQDADLKLTVNTNNETSIFLGDIADKLSFVHDESFDFYVNKENIIKTLCHAYTFPKPFYPNVLSTIWFSSQFKLIESFFGAEMDVLYKTTFVLQTQNRKYIKGLKQVGGFNIRNFLIQDHSILEFKKANDGKIYLIIGNTDEPSLEPEILESGSLQNIPRQKIIYGAPGTGKSHELKEQVETNFKPENTTRVTFHPSYSYQQFIGSYKPTPIYKEILGTDKLYGIDGNLVSNQKEPIIDYTFVPGPFLKLLIRALKSKDTNDNFVLIIEEINRASVASVFGDVFQLLDRNESGESEYTIQFNTDISNYLIREEIADVNIRLPHNFFIWATMNSADQGVMPLDSAFKRRWSFEYLPLNDKEFAAKDRSIVFQEKSYNWNAFRNALNEELKKLSIPEDKLIGPFFMKQNELKDSKIIKNKLLMYLRDDIVRHKPECLFLKTTFSDILDDYKKGNSIFRNNIIDSLTPLNESKQESDSLEEEN